ncbi:DNA-processing protein DprA [Flaviflexus massiliensis]|uniref:DNA-processing protein DprA n=1 Tax=Flaviflexus massiliensis TaxID=1522309 RepID=UPI0006D53AAD|nr:DNA-processing protein DprA [Flaviflexus massiliensis]
MTLTLTGKKAALGVWTHLIEPGDPPPERVRQAPIKALKELVTGTLVDDRAERWRTRYEGLSPDILSGTFPINGHFLVPGDAHWPLAMGDLGDVRPLGLWVLGNTEVLTLPAVSIVGARAATNYGTSVATDLGRDLASTHVLVSGGAYGIDAAVHRAALAHHGRTIVVLAGGADRVYPAAHRELFDAVLISGGAIVSEQPPGAAPARHRFLSRNRIIAALGQTTIVIEAGYRSGALSTARWAAEIGRDVGAVPGPVTSALSQGTNQLLRDYGVCITRANDIRELLGGIVPDSFPVVSETAYDRLSERDKRVWNALAPSRVSSTPAVAQEAGLSAREAMTALEFLKTMGLARSIAGRWIRVKA